MARPDRRPQNLIHRTSHEDQHSNARQCGVAADAWRTHHQDPVMNCNVRRNATGAVLVAMCLALCTLPGWAQTRTVGLLLHDSTRTTPGYTLFAPLRSRTTYLIDMNGMLVHDWRSLHTPGLSAMLLPDGSLLRAALVQAGNPFASQGGAGGRVERISWDGVLQWSYDHYGTDMCAHHDVEAMPNGNVLMIVWEEKSMSEIVAAGRNTAGAPYTEIWSEKIIEVQPNGASGGTIVWEWHVWDHLVQDFDAGRANYGSVSEHPELMDINAGDRKTDWLHINAIRYNAARDEIMLSVHATSELWVIDHGTTTAEAASHSGGRRGKGGDILYRWGNPRTCKLGTTADQKLYAQHDARWIETGRPGADDILVFNNGTNRPGGSYSSVEQITPPVATDGSYTRETGQAFAPSATSWTFSATPRASFYSTNIGGAMRLQDGNTVICEGADGRLFEVTTDGRIVWEYMNPVGAAGPIEQGTAPANNQVFKVCRYAADAPELRGRVLTSRGPIEQYPTDVHDGYSTPLAGTVTAIAPNPFNTSTTIDIALARGGHVVLDVCDLLGRSVRTLVDDVRSAGLHHVVFDGAALPSGSYLLRLRTAEGVSVRLFRSIR
jgi:hypothetical protein